MTQYHSTAGNISQMINVKKEEKEEEEEEEEEKKKRKSR